MDQNQLVVLGAHRPLALLQLLANDHSPGGKLLRTSGTVPAEARSKLTMSYVCVLHLSFDASEQAPDA
jgi:hypothetical protein